MIETAIMVIGGIIVSTDEDTIEFLYLAWYWITSGG